MKATAMPWKPEAERFMDFMSAAPTAYHACELLAKDFDNAGFIELSEREEWDITSHSKFFIRRNGSAIMGFVIGKDWVPGNGVGVVATHTDALCGRVKPISIKEPVDGYNLMGVAPYSGAFSPVWLDRDLGIGGRLIVREEHSKSVTTKLVHVPYPIARIPTLAPHFGAVANLPLNPETQMTPVIGLTSSKEVEEPTDEEKKSPMVGKHSIDLLRILAKYADVSVKDILQVELELFDTQEPVIGGLNHEFIFCPRVDDKLCTYTAVQGFIEATHDSRALNVVACYDNEEVGSGTRQGAQGDMFQCIIERVIGHKMDPSSANLVAENTHKTYANSFMVSADVGHAVNPNFPNAYLEHHKPQLNYGMTLKVYPNAATTSDAVSMALIEEIARRTGNRTQVMHTRNDTRAGGTLGKFLASATGMRAVDAGIAQLSMHSIRATLGSKDISLGTRFFKDFYTTWYEVDQEWKNGGI